MASNSVEYVERRGDHFFGGGGVYVLVQRYAGYYPDDGTRRSRVQTPKELWGAGTLADYAPYFVAAKDYRPLDYRVAQERIRRAA